MRRQLGNSDETCIRVYIGEVDRLCRHGVCNRRPPTVEGGFGAIRVDVAPSEGFHLNHRHGTSCVDAVGIGLSSGLLARINLCHRSFRPWCGADWPVTPCRTVPTEGCGSS